MRRSGRRVVSTQIDNYNFFGILANAVYPVRLVAIQNGIRLHHELRTLRGTLIGNHVRSEGLLHDIYLCWGMSDIVRMRHAGLTGRVVLPVGSLRDSLHRASGDLKYPGMEIAVVMVKRKDFRTTTSTYLTHVWESRRAVFDALRGYVRKTELVPEFVVAPGPAEQIREQRRIVEREYGTTVVIRTSSDWSSSYDSVMSAGVVIGDNSSLLVEALGRGRRILSVNMTDDPSLDFPVEGPWTLKKPTYEEFAERLTWIRSMSDTEWAGLIGDVPKYLVNYNPQYPTHDFVKDLIMAIAEDRPWPEVTW